MISPPNDKSSLVIHVDFKENHVVGGRTTTRQHCWRSTSATPRPLDRSGPGAILYLDILSETQQKDGRLETISTVGV